MVQLPLTSINNRKLRLVPYGPSAVAALRETIDAAKSDNPLTPVTVAVPSNYAGISLRRTLASSGGGLVNVRFLVLARVAELLGAPLLAQQGRRPLTSSVRGEAVRAVLAEDPGIFRDAAAHAATERSLEATFRDLRLAPTDSLEALAAQSTRASHIVRLYRAFRERTRTYYDEEDLFDAAAQALRAEAPALRDIGHVVLYLPRRLTRSARVLLEALAERSALTTIIGLTGDEEADTLARDLASQLASALGPARETAPSEPPIGTRIVAVTDAEEEVRTALRLTMERLKRGTPLHRLAVLYPVAEPYAVLTREQFAAAGVPHNGPAVRSLAQTVSGRVLLGLLRLRERDFRRDAVMDWLSGAPILETGQGNPAPAHRWDALARAAGVIGGADQWAQRLARHLRSLEEQYKSLTSARDDEESSEGHLRRIEADIQHTKRLAAFIDELIAQTKPSARSTWEQFAAWGRELLARYLGGEGHRRDWPEEEIEAHRAVEAALDALADLGAIRERVDEPTFRRALERELETPAARTGRFGEGVFLGRIDDAFGTDFDAVYLIGLSEGLLPSHAREDPLLPDDERAQAGSVPLRARQQEERRDYLAALACAPERVLIFPRADLRGQRGKLPARWLLETASRLEGRTVFSGDLDTLSRDWYQAIPSFEGALKDGLAPASPQEYDLRSLVRWRESGGDVFRHYLVAETPPLRAGLAAQRKRRSDEFSRWDGFLGKQPDLRPSADQPISPTALQDWAACPFRYFLGHVLYVTETAVPEEALSITALERGNLMHAVLEQFLNDAPPRTSPEQPWSPDERALLRRIAERVCDEFEAAGRTGRRLLWRLDRGRILSDLMGFLDADEELRKRRGVVPEQAELMFGQRNRSPVVVTLDDGRAVGFRGRIDRVDRAPDGSSLLVLDYKTGKPDPYKKLSERVPVLGGKFLQLPIYALAAQEQYGACATRAYYWFVREQHGYELRGYVVEKPQLDAFRSTLATIVDGIEAGVFPPRPGKASREGFENCQICPYDRVCSVDRGRAWERKSATRELASYLRLTEEQS